MTSLTWDMPMRSIFPNRVAGFWARLEGSPDEPPAALTDVEVAARTELQLTIVVVFEGLRDGQQDCS